MPPDDVSTARLSVTPGEFELLIAGDGKVTRFPLPKTGDLSIGRGDDVSIVLAGHGVSRRHARLHARGTDFTLEDLGSSNGTILRGQALLPGQPAPKMHATLAAAVNCALAITRRLTSG